MIYFPLALILQKIWVRYNCNAHTLATCNLHCTSLVEALDGRPTFPIRGFLPTDLISEKPFGGQTEELLFDL